MKVSVIMLTYGQDIYIKEAIEGVLMQEFSDGIELIVSNDNSPDRTDAVIEDIIKNHPNGSWIKYTCQQSNLGMNANFYWAVKQAKGKYIAICDGDDYWTDPLKIKKQVHFLENNSDYSMTFHNALEVGNDGPLESQLFSRIGDRDYSEIELFEEWLVPTGSMVFRKSVITSDIYSRITKEKDLMFVDNLLLMISSAIGNLRGFNEQMMAYRRHEGGVIFKINYTLVDKLNKQNILFGKYFPPLSLSVKRIVFERNFQNLKGAILKYDIKGIFIFTFYTMKYLLKKSNTQNRNNMMKISFKI